MLSPSFVALIGFIVLLITLIFILIQILLTGKSR